MSHLAAEVPLLVVAGLQIAHGWVPTSDDAVIAWRSWNVFSGPVPLTGQYSQISAGGGHSAFDLGPLQYFLLAVPARIDPVHGILWGSAVLAAGLAALAIEAMWSAFGPVGAAATSLAVALCVATLAQATVNLAWNPSLGVYALFATMAATIAVACDRVVWLPVAIGTGSLAIECHTSFALPAVAAIALAVVVGLVRRAGSWWKAIGVATLVGIACWIAPLVQQLSDRPGNFSVVFSSLGRHGPAVGLGMGLRGIAAATRFPPSWWLHVPAVSAVSSYGPFERTVYRGSLVWGVAALAICGTVAMAAALTHRRGLATLAVVATVTGLAGAWTLGSVPVSQAPYLVYYLYFLLWPIGMLIAAVFVAALVTAIQQLGLLLVGRPNRSGARQRSPARWSKGLLATGTPASIVLAIGLAAVGTALVVLDLPFGSSPLFLLGWTPVRQSRAAVAQALPLLRREEPPGHRRPFRVETSPSFILFQPAVGDGVAYLLVTKGYPARVTGSADRPLGPAYTAATGSPTLLIEPRPTGGVEVRWQPAAGP